MAVIGNKAAADMGRSNYPANDVGNMLKYKKDVAEKGKDEALRTLARKRIQLKSGAKKNAQDFMPKGLRKVADGAGEFVGTARSVGTNVDALLKAVSKKRLGLPRFVKRGLDNPITAVSDPVASADRTIRGKRK